MKRHRDRVIAGVLALAVVPVAFAACGGSSANTATATAAAASAKSATGKPSSTVGVGSTGLGKILVDSTGRTLYLFKADSSTRSACSGACATAWPPLTAGAAPAVTGGANAALVGAISRSDGSRQVTYNGHPLYLFVKDQKPGDVNGQGLTAFGGAWFAVSPAGNQISSHPTGHGSATTSSHPAAPTAPPAAKPQPAPKPTPPPAAKPAPPVAKPAPPANGIPQNNGGDGDADNNGGPSDGDGNV
jgi:predicted lipoprotein with Yx(FWY)xxD motif